MKNGKELDICEGQTAFEKVFGWIQFPEPLEIQSRNEFRQAWFHYFEPLMENAIIRISEPKNTTEESDEIHTK